VKDETQSVRWEGGNYFVRHRIPRLLRGISPCCQGITVWTSGSALGDHSVNPGQQGLTLYIHLHKVGSDLYVEPKAICWLCQFCRNLRWPLFVKGGVMQVRSLQNCTPLQTLNLSGCALTNASVVLIVDILKVSRNPYHPSCHDPSVLCWNEFMWYWIVPPSNMFRVSNPSTRM